MPSFIGSDIYAIDHKGRIAIPASMRRGDSPKRTLTTFVLNRGFDGCVALYAPEGWQRWMDRLRRRSAGDPNARAFQRMFMKDARKVTVDAQGRITIPPALIGHAALGKEAMLHGAGDHIEVWDPRRFDAALAPVAEKKGEYERLAFELFEDEA